jgi:hypothetical protein
MRNARRLIPRLLLRTDPLLSRGPRPCPPTNKENPPRPALRLAWPFNTKTRGVGWDSDVSAVIKSAVIRLSITITMPSKGKKRKMEEEVEKFYAVRAGFTPGVYSDWTDCQEQISGFKGAQCEYAPVVSL